MKPGSRGMGRTLILPAVLLMIACEATGQTFTPVTEGDIVNDGGWNYGAAWIDYDTDGFLDLFVINNEDGNLDNFLYHSNGNGTFTRILEDPVVQDSGQSYGCTWSDYNNDSYPDLFVSNYNENNFLYTNNGDGTFELVVEGAIVTDEGSSVGCSWGDYDNDGQVDLYVCNRNEPGFLYHNEGDGTFTRILEGDISTDNYNSGGCTWGDYDGDGFIDLFVANAGPAVNLLYHNDGDGTFTKVEEDPVVTDEAHSSGGNWVDFDNDGDLDLFVTSGVIGMDQNFLYRNEGDGSFTSVTEDPVVDVNHWAGGSNWADFDNDGDLDLVVGSIDGNNLMFLNDGAGSFTQIDTGAVVEDGDYSQTPVWGDYDNDGDLDLFIAKNNFFGGNNVLFNNQGTGNNWLKVKCTGTESNASAIGTILRAYATVNDLPVQQTRVISSQSGGGQSGQNSMNAWFGLSDTETVDSLHITWPSGLVETYTNLAVNQALIMVEGEMPMPPDITLPLTSHDFGMVYVDSTATWKLPIVNDGEGNLVVYPLEIDDPVFTAEQFDSLIIEPGASDSVLISFTPSDEIPYIAAITIISNDPDEAELEVQVEGEGLFWDVVIDDETVVPGRFSIESVYPNPFNPATNITIGMPEKAQLYVYVSDILGRRVLDIADGVYPLGNHRFKFNAEGLPSGTYFVRAIVPGRTDQVRQIILMK